MKLIIDIDDEEYKFIKDLRSLIIGGRGSCKTIQYNVINAIKNGTPISTECDLISREALKKAIGELFDNGGYDSGLVMNTIDNAPTIPLPDFKEGYKQAIIDGKTNFSRPQGKWKETGYETGALGITYRQTQCSNCGWEHALPMWLNYCPNCGAKMFGGAK